MEACKNSVRAFLTGRKACESCAYESSGQMYERAGAASKTAESAKSVWDIDNRAWFSMRHDQQWLE